MASIFKRRKGKNEPYTIQYVDHLGKRRTVQGFTDKGLTEQLASKLETEARLRKTGMVDAEQEQYADRKNSPIAAHLLAFKESLGANSPHHVKVTMLRVNCVVEGCDCGSLADINGEAVQTFLRSLRKKINLSH